MEKIEYYCGQKDIPYIFPERKWYERNKRGREVKILLKAEEHMDLPFSVLLHIEEKQQEKKATKKKEKRKDNKINKKKDERKGKKKTDNSNKPRAVIRMYPRELACFYEAFLTGPGTNLYQYDKLICFDGGETECFITLLQNISARLNELIVVTSSPFAYQMLFDRLLEENGLTACCVNSIAQLPLLASHEQRQLSRKSPANNRYGENVRQGRTGILYGNFGKKPLPFSFETDCHFFDLSFDDRYQREIRVKRPDITYFGVGKFLDTTVKLRYNTIVKDGSVNQYVIEDNNKKLQYLEREKDGRKEKYSNLRRLKEI